MPTRQEGARIGAVLKADESCVWLIGYGVYAGDEIPPEDGCSFNLPIPNPKLVMDDGQVAWGCECWWGPEDKVRSMIGDRRVIHVDIGAERREHLERGAS